MEFDKLTIKNYKCFDENGTTIETIKPINVIIGKNNSGKSSVIDIFKFLTTNDNTFLKSRRNGLSTELEFEHILNASSIRQSFPENTRGGDIPGANHQVFGLSLVNSIVKYSIGENGRNVFKNIDKSIPASARNYLDSYVNRIISPFKEKQFKIVFYSFY